MEIWRGEGLSWGIGLLFVMYALFSSLEEKRIDVYIDMQLNISSHPIPAPRPNPFHSPFMLFSSFSSLRYPLFLIPLPPPEFQNTNPTNSNQAQKKTYNLPSPFPPKRHIPHKTQKQHFCLSFSTSVSISIVISISNLLSRYKRSWRRKQRT